MHQDWNGWMTAYSHNGALHCRESNVPIPSTGRHLVRRTLESQTRQYILCDSIHIEVKCSNPHPRCQETGAWGTGDSNRGWLFHLGGKGRVLTTGQPGNSSMFSFLTWGLTARLSPLHWKSLTAQWLFVHICVMFQREVQVTHKTYLTLR